MSPNSQHMADVDFIDQILIQALSLQFRIMGSCNML